LGHKVHPIGFRLGIIKDWQSKWYSEAHYAEFVLEDNRLRESIKAKYPEAAISQIVIDRQAKDVTITLHTARPGIVIGRGGQRVDEMRQYLEHLVGKKIRLNIQEIRQPELDAYLVARSIAEQIERRVAYRRAMKQAIFRTIQAGAKGIKVSAAGRLGNAEIARRQTSHQGQVPLHTLRADIDYGFTEARTTLGRIGVKVWIYKGQIMPELKAEMVEEKPAEAAPAVEAEEKPAVTEERAAKKVAEAVAAVSPEEKPLAPVEKPVKKAVEAAPAAERKEKPVKAVAKAVPEAKPKEKPVKVVAKAAPEAKPKEKPVKVVAKAAPEAKPKEKPVKVAAKAAPEAKPEEKPAKPRAKKTVKTAEAPEVKAPATKKAAKKATAEPAAPKKPRKTAAVAKAKAKAKKSAPKVKKTTKTKAKEK
jgi:small subunit ribosomal protein S3